MRGYNTLDGIEDGGVRVAIIGKPVNDRSKDNRHCKQIKSNPESILERECG